MQYIRATVAATLIGSGLVAFAASATPVAADADPYGFCARYYSGPSTEHVACPFAAVGASTFTIPSGASSISVFGVGGRGASTDSPGDLLPNISLSGPLGDQYAGATVQIRVGGDAAPGGGWNGGGDSASGGPGGGASDISLDGTRVFVAPGGGGAGGVGQSADDPAQTMAGGNGGTALTAALAGTTSNYGCDLSGGSPGAMGGTGGTGGTQDNCDGTSTPTGQDGTAGTAVGQGGTGGTGDADGAAITCPESSAGSAGGGGGGGGYVGGGGGGAGGSTPDGPYCGGGGGGAGGSYLTPDDSAFTIADTTAAPVIVIEWDQYAAPVTFSNGAPPNAAAGKPYSFPFTAANCVDCRFARVAGLGGAPAGLRMSSTGVLSGTPSSAGTYRFTIRATDASERTADYPVVLRVIARALTIDDTTVQESDGVAVVTVTLAPAATSAVTVKYVTGSGSATSPADYTATNGTLTFAPGETTKTVQVPVVNDTKHEPAETFRVRLSGASNATIVRSSATVTIAASD